MRWQKMLRRWFRSVLLNDLHSRARAAHAQAVQMMEPLEPRVLLSTAIDVELIPLSQASGSDTTVALPQADDDFYLGEDFVVEVWVRSVDGTQNGITGGYMDFTFDESIVTATGITGTTTFPQIRDFENLNTPGLVDNLGGGRPLSGSTDLGVSSWARLGIVDFSTDAAGSFDFVAGRGVALFARDNDGNIPEADTEYNDPQTSLNILTADPQGDITDVTPDPRTTAVDSIDIVFDRAVSGVTLDDLTLTRNDGPDLLAGSGAVLTNSGDDETYTLSGLAALTNADGDYVLTVNAAGSGIADPVTSETLQADITEAFAVDVTAPTADVTDVTPDPRNSVVNEVTITFSEPIDAATFTLDDLTLTRNGVEVEEGSDPVIVQDDAQTFRITQIDNVITDDEGTYVLTLNAGSVADLAGNLLAADASDTWVMDTTGPTADITDITPDPRNTVVNQVTIEFSEAIDASTFTLDDLLLTRNGVEVEEGGEPVIVQIDADTFRIEQIDNVITDDEGTYVLTLSAGSVTDLAGNALVGGASDTWVMDTTAPQATMEEVAPDPRDVPINEVDVSFDEDVTGVTLDDFTLTRNGTAIDLAASGALINPTDARNYTITLGAVIIDNDGTYELTLNSAGTGITDAAGNVAAGDSDTFVVDTTGPTVTAVSPAEGSITGQAVSQITVTFDDLAGVDQTSAETVANYDLIGAGEDDDFTNGTVDLNGRIQDVSFDPQTGVATITLSPAIEPVADPGFEDFRLTVTGVDDVLGNTQQGSSETEFRIDTRGPVATITPVDPDPRNTSIDSVEIDFSEAITGFDIGDITITRDNGADLLAGSGATLTDNGGNSFNLSGLAGIIAAEGNYTIFIDAETSGVEDVDNLALIADETETFTVDLTAPTLAAVAVASDTGVSGDDEETFDTTPVITLTFSEVVEGDAGDITVTDPSGNPVAPASVIGFGTNSLAITLNALAEDGDYTVTIDGDAGGLTDEATNAFNGGVDQSVTFTLDTTDPTVDEVLTPDTGSVDDFKTNSTSPTVTFNADEALFADASDFVVLDPSDNPLTQGVDYTVSGLGTSTVTLSFINLAADGVYDINIDADNVTDRAGNPVEGGGATTVNFELDTTQATLDDVTLNPDTGDSGADDLTNDVDPVVTFDFSEDLIGGTGNVVVTGPGGTLTQGVDYTVAGLDGSTDLVTVTFAGLTVDGDYTITIDGASGATDEAGNDLAGGDQQYTFTFDSTGPTVASSSPADGASVSNDNLTTITVTFNDANGLDESTVTTVGNYTLLDGAQQPVAINDVVLNGSIATITLGGALADDTYELTVGTGVLDAAGNALNDGTAEVITFEIDTAAPTVTIDALTTDDNTPELTGDVDDPDAVVEVTVNGQTVQATNNGDNTWTLADDALNFVPDGVYDVSVTATDPALNQASDATNDELTITDPFEVDDAFVTANAFDTEGGPESRSLHVVDDIDFVTFTVTEALQYDVDVVAASGNPQLTVTLFSDDQGTVVDTVTSNGTAELSQVLQPGTYWVSVEGDGATVVPDYSLNITSLPDLTVNIADPTDTLGQGFGGSIISGGPDGSVFVEGQVFVDINNISSRDIDEATNAVVRVYLSTDGTLDGADTQIGSDTIDLNGLNAGSSFENVGIDVTIPDGLDAGDYFLIAEVDATDQVQEINEDNNVSAGVAREVSALAEGGQGDDRGRINVTDGDGTQGIIRISGGAEGQVVVDADGNLDLIITNADGNDSIRVFARGGEILNFDDLIVLGGGLRTINARNADFDGEVLVPDGTVNNIRVNNIGDLFINTNNAADPNALRSIVVFEAVNSDWVINGGVNVVRVGTWNDGTLTADSIRALRVIPGRNVADGDFNVDITLNGAAQGPTLGSALIRGSIANTTWDITGDVRRVQVDNTLAWTLDVNGGDLRALRGGIFLGSSVDVTGDISQIVVANWTGGMVSADTLRVLRTTGAFNTNGDFNTDLDINGGTSTDLLAAIIRGQVDGVTWDIDGGLRILRADTLSNSNVNVDGDANNLRFGQVTDSGLTVGGDIRSLTLDDGDNFDVTADSINNMRVRGGRNVDGDFSGDITLRGDANGDALSRLLVRGVFSGELRADGDVTSVILGAIENGDILLGVDGGVNGLPEYESDFDVQDLTLRRLVVTGRANDPDAGWINSRVAAWNIDRVRLADVQLENNGVPHGFAADDVNRIDRLEDLIGDIENTDFVLRVVDPQVV